MDDLQKPCECKGKRTCLLCEHQFKRKARDLFSEFKQLDSHVFCPTCSKIFKGWDVIANCDGHKSNEGKEFSGVFLHTEFLTSEEAESIVCKVDSSSWDLSQSGRRKKNFGPKINFKKKKLRVDNFQGFSDYSDFVRRRLNEVEVTKDIQIIEECYLEYEEARGSHIEPHIDDCWIWGERIVTVNCIGDTVLNLTKHVLTYPQQYNMDSLELFKDKLIGTLESEIPDNIVIRIPLPARSLMVIYGAPRYQYEHSVLREDISGRRVCIAYREFTIPYLHMCENFLKLDENKK